MYLEEIFVALVAVLISSVPALADNSHPVIGSVDLDSGESNRFIGTVYIDCDVTDRPVVAGEKVSVYFLTEENCTVFYEYMVNDDCASVSIINGDSGGCREMIIPGEITHYGHKLPVTKISDKAFALKAGADRFGTEGLEKLIISEGVEEIGESAFMYATSLNEIIFPESLCTIKFWAFANCKDLKSVKFPEKSKLKTMSAGAFDQCVNLENVELPALLEEIPDRENVFFKCQSIKSLKVAPCNKFFKAEDNMLYTIDGKRRLYPKNLPGAGR